MPGWMVSPLCSNNHITVPQTIAANTEKYLESGGIGLVTAVGGCGLGVARGMNDAITREQMYSTTYIFFIIHVQTYTSASHFFRKGMCVERTCSLIGFLSPKTR